MKITRIEPLRCPLCNSFRVTRSDEKLITCLDCRRITGYKKPDVKSEAKQQETNSQSGSIRPSVLVLLMAIPVTFAVYSSTFMQDNEAREQENETQEQTVVDTNITMPPEESNDPVDTRPSPTKIGECFIHRSERPCSPDAPDWENDDESFFVYRIIEDGLKKVRVAVRIFDCQSSPKVAYYWTSTNVKEYLSLYAKVECPEGLLNLEAEDEP